MSKTCKACVHAKFQRTPTGRIKKGSAGACLMADEMARLAKENAAPCLEVKVHRMSIWPDTDANACTRWTSTTPQKPTSEPTTCQAGRDGECTHPKCPQIRDNEPHATGRHCPLDHDTEDQTA